MLINFITDERTEAVSKFLGAKGYSFYYNALGYTVRLNGVSVIWRAYFTLPDEMVRQTLEHHIRLVFPDVLVKYLTNGKILLEALGPNRVVNVHCDGDSLEWAIGRLR